MSPVSDQDVFGAPAPRAVRGRGKGREYIDPAGIRRDRWDRPLLPDPDTGEVVPWTSVTTLAGTLADRYALGRWQLRQVVIGMGMRHDLVALASSVNADDPDGARAELNGIADDAMEAAGSSKGRNLGSAMHDLVKAFNRADMAGRTDIVRRANPILAPGLKAYARALEEYGLRPLPDMVERMCACGELRTAGTFDAAYECADGYVRIGDLKTGQKANSYGQYELAQQLALYANADYIWRVTDASTGAGVYEDIPYQIDDQVGLQIWLPSGGEVCEVNVVNLTEGMHEARRASNVRARRKMASEWVRPAPKVAPVEPPAAPAPAEPALAELAPAPAPAEPEIDGGTAALDDLMMLRIRAATMTELRELATTPPPRWTGAMQEAARQRWEELVVADCAV